MKFNWKILVAVIFLIGSIIWGVNALRSHSYNGTNLDFMVGGGAVTVTNASENPISVRLVSTHTGTFSVSSDIEDVSGRSIIQRNDSRSSQLFEFILPPGESEFTVIRGTDVRFVANSDVLLKAVAQPMNDGSVKTTCSALPS